MAQFNFGNPNATDISGTEFTNNTKAWIAAAETSHSGASRPSYAKKGTVWLKDSVSPNEWYMFDGTRDILLETFSNTGAVSLISNTRLADMPAGTVKMRRPGSAGSPTDVTLETLRADLNVSSFKNRIINPNGTINQRRSFGGYVTGAYREDRWKGHANGKEQIIEQANVPAGNYVLSWEGGGNGRVNGSTARASPITIALPGTGNVSIVVPQDATAVQFEAGSVPSPLEFRPTAIELILCQYYFQKTFPMLTTPTANQGFDGSIVGTSVGTNISATWSFAVPMRVVPSLSAFNPANDASPGFRNFANNQTVSATIHNVTERGVTVITSVAASNQFHGIHLIASAEL